MKVKEPQLKPAEVIRRRLHAAGLKCTPQRREIFDEIVRIGGHFSAEDLVERFRSRRGKRATQPVISRATVYRTLSILVQCGLVREVLFTENHTHYEAAYSRTHHEHMICTKCGRAIEFDDSDLERALHKAARAAGFSPVSHTIEVYGLCDRCR
jgi:Fur family ferric uptake transcriptional regulator